MGIQRVFAENVRKYRKRARMTQEDLAEKSGLHRTYIGGIEQQRINVSLKNVEKIACALDVDPALLFVRESPTDQQASKASRGESQIAQLSQGDHALCSWTDKGIVVDPINVNDEDMTISILCALINDGHADDLAEAYEETQTQLLKYFRSTRNA